MRASHYRFYTHTRRYYYFFVSYKTAADADNYIVPYWFFFLTTAAFRFTRAYAYSFCPYPKRLKNGLSRTETRGFVETGNIINNYRPGIRRPRAYIMPRKTLDTGTREQCRHSNARRADRSSPAARPLSRNRVRDLPSKFYFLHSKDVEDTRYVENPLIFTRYRCI